MQASSVKLYIQYMIIILMIPLDLLLLSHQLIVVLILDKAGALHNQMIVMKKLASILMMMILMTTTMMERIYGSPVVPSVMKVFLMRAWYDDDIYITLHVTVFGKTCLVHTSDFGHSRFIKIKSGRKNIYTSEEW